VQYALDLPTGLLRVRRVLFGALHFPANYGFAPRTMGADDAPVDVLVMGQAAIAPLAITCARAVGELWFDEGGRRHDKVLAVHANDPVFSSYRNVAELPRYLRAQIERFFDDYRKLEGVVGTTCGFGGPEDALALLARASVRYAASRGTRRATSGAQAAAP
jgi:inorganic pyrophosphatase